MGKYPPLDEWKDRDRDRAEGGIGEIALSFRFGIDPGVFVEEAERTHGDYNEIAVAYQRAVAAALAPAASGHEIRVEPWYGAKTTGPGGPGWQSVVELLDVLPWDWIGRVADLAALATVIRAFTGRIRKVTGYQAGIGSGPAIIYAAAAIQDLMPDLMDLTLAFAAPLHRHALNEEAMMESGSTEGWLVGFRDETSLYIVVVRDDGSVALPTISPNRGAVSLGDLESLDP